MTSEHRFISSFTSVWRDVTPLSDGYWHVENMLVERAYIPISNRAPKEMRGLVNELAFIAFSLIVATKRDANRSAVLDAVQESIPAAVKYINRVSSGDAVSNDLVDDVCVREAGHLAFRLLAYFPVAGGLTVRPKFVGCGTLSACEGDVVARNCLYEVKAGDRGFRVSDIRQLLVYSALAYASNKLTFERVGLFNPRTGMAWSRQVDDVCMAVSGLRATDVLPRLIDHFMATSVSR